MPASQTAPTWQAMPHLTTLVGVKMRQKNGVIYLQTHCRNATLFTKGTERLQAIMENEYLPALAALVAMHGLDAVRSNHAVLEQRLNRGWEIESAKADDLFVELLTQFEVLEDALRLHSPEPYRHPLTVLRARIAEIAAVQ